MRPWRVVAVGYANARPLLEGLSRDPRVQLSLGPPSWCADELRAGRADVGLVPTVEVLTDPSLSWVGTGVIAARAGSMSTLMVADRPLTELTAVRLSAASRSTNALARIVLARRLGTTVQWLEPHGADPGVPAARIGRIVIGDPAFAKARRHAHVWDLAGLWREDQGVPFVFACFAAKGAVDPALVQRLDRARALGLSRLDAIAADVARDLELPARTMARYFAQALHYELDDHDRAGVRTFARLLGLPPRAVPGPGDAVARDMVLGVPS